MIARAKANRVEIKKAKHALRRSLKTQKQMQQLYKKLSSRIEEIGFTLQENDEFLKNDYAGVNWEVVAKNLEDVFDDLSDDEEEKLK